jgi:hypothetical protein
MALPLYYKIKKEKNGKIEWMFNVEFDDPREPNRMSVTWVSDRMQGFLLDQKTAEMFLKRANDPSITMEPE